MANQPYKYAYKARLYRKKEGLTQSAAAKECGVDLETFERWEGGQHQPLTATFIRIMKGLKISLDAFDAEDFEERGLSL